MIDLMQRFDTQEEELHRNAQASALMLRDLQAKLDERRATIANLNGRYCKPFLHTTVPYEFDRITSSSTVRSLAGSRCSSRRWSSRTER